MTIFDLALDTKDKTWFNKLNNIAKENLSDEQINVEQMYWILATGKNVKVVSYYTGERKEYIIHSKEFENFNNANSIFAYQRNIIEDKIELYLSK